MNRWITKKIADIADVVAGGTPSTNNSEFWNGDIGWITPADLSGYKYRYIANGTRNISSAGLNNSSAYLLPKNTVLLSSRAPIGYVAIAEKELATNQGFKNLICDDTQVDYRFMYYWLQLNADALKSFASGATFPELSAGTVKKIKVTLPDIVTQNRIADILFAYDELIEANTRRIELLEQTAQELYKEWFVRFRFPGHEKTKFENGLPEGWSYEKFKDELIYNTGKLDSNAAVSDGEYSFYTCAKTIYKTNTYCFDGECVLLGGNNATGDFSLFYANEKLDAYQRTYIVTPQNQTLSCPYIYFVLKDYLLQFKTASIGATTKFLTKGMLDKAKILVPDEKTIRRYNEIAKNMFDQIVSLKAKNENLVSQRNMLLPRLMSGKLEV